MNPEKEIRGLLLAKPSVTLAVAESITCGQLQARIGATPGASDYFLGGLTAYTLEQKVKLLSVNKAHARSVNCVSQRVAVEMAQGACELFGADLALATTGYAQKDVAAGIAAPMAWWALCHQLDGGQCVVISEMIALPVKTSRVAAQERVTLEVLSALVAYLQEFRG